MIRVLARVTSDNDLPARVHAYELPAVVEAYGERTAGMAAAFDDYVDAEITVRAAYKGLPQIAEAILRARSWAERAKDLVADGWAWIRGMSRRSGKVPELAPEPVLEGPSLVADRRWEAITPFQESMAVRHEEDDLDPRDPHKDQLDRAKKEDLKRSLQASKDPPQEGPGRSGRTR